MMSEIMSASDTVSLNFVLLLPFVVKILDPFRSLQIRVLRDLRVVLDDPDLCAKGEALNYKNTRED